MKSHKKQAAFRCTTVILSALIVLASLSLTGCSLRSLILNRDQTPNDTTTIQPENTDQTNSNDETKNENEMPPENKPVLPSHYNPLTGLAAETDMSLIRPVAVYTEHIYEVAAAEIVIEAPIEGGKTKFMMLTTSYTGVTQIGAISSSRLYLQSFASAFGAVSVCAGISDRTPIGSNAQYPVIDCVKDGLSTVFYRDSNDESEKYLYTSGTRLIGALENFQKCGATLPYLQNPYGTSLSPNGKAATGVVIPYSSDKVTQFAYDKARQTYIYTQTGIAAQTTDSNEISFTNLLLLTCESAVLNKVTGTEFELNTESGGVGQYISGGKYIDIQWSRDEAGNLSFCDQSGAPLSINRGNTYIGLIDLAESSSLLIVN